MKRIRKNQTRRRALPLVWQDAAWTTRVNVRLQPVCVQRQAGLPFSPFRGFHFPQPATQNL